LAKSSHFFCIFLIEFFLWGEFSHYCDKKIGIIRGKFAKILENFHQILAICDHKSEGEKNTSNKRNESHFGHFFPIFCQVVGLIDGHPQDE
jgi:hypothetical protein